MNTSKDTKLAQMQSLLHDESSPLGMESAIHTDASRAASKQSMLSSKRSGSPTSRGGAMHEMKQMNSMRDSVENSIPHGHGSHGSRSKTSFLSRQSSKKSSRKDLEEGEKERNVFYNILDLFSKCFVGIFFWAYYTKVFKLP